MSDDVLVTLAHVREALPRRCSRGLRNWAAFHGFDWNDFVHNGVTASRLLETGDSMILPVIEIAKREAALHGR